MIEIYLMKFKTYLIVILINILYLKSVYIKILGI